MKFEPTFSPVNRDFLFDLASNFIAEPLRVTVHV